MGAADRAAQAGKEEVTAMPAGGVSAGAVYAEAALDISKFQASVGRLAAEAGKIASAMDLAASGTGRLEAGLTGLGAGFQAATAAMTNSGAAVASAQALGRGVISALNAAAGQAGSVGARFSSGLAAGIRSGQGGVVAAARSVAMAAASAARAALKIHSPSRVTQRFGEYFDKGFVRGVEGGMPRIDRAVERAVYVKPPAMSKPAAEAGTAAPAGAAPIDYAALAEASAARPITMQLDGREVARINAGNAARSQNARNRYIALRYGAR